MDDARRRRAWRRGLPGSKAGRPDAEKLAPRATAVRRGAGDAGRAEDPDHPCLLRVGAAPVSARGEHRGAFRDARPADGGAAVCRRAARNDHRSGGRAVPGWPRPSPRSWSAAASPGSTRCSREIVRKRDGLRDFIDELAGDAVPYASLFEEFGFAPGETAEAIAAFDLAAARISDRRSSSAFADAAEAADARSVLEQHPALRGSGFCRGRSGETAGASGARVPQGRRRALRPSKTFKKALLAAFPT